MRKISAIILNLILLTLLQTFLRIAIREGISYYIKYFDLYSLMLDLTVSFLVTIFLIVIYIITKNLMKGQAEMVYAIALSIIGIIFLYLLRAFGNGFVVILGVTIETLKNMIPVLVTSLILPFSATSLRKFLSK